LSALLDTSVLIGALLPQDADHAACCGALSQPDCVIHVHALNETFATLTGGSMGFRVDADAAASLIRERIASRVQVIVLGADETLEAHGTARARGVRGGAIYDYMHLVAARKARCAALCTLNISDFLAFRRADDPEIRSP
jgi:hypothetical protein